ncbi:MAG: TonB-dependent receptor [Cytophagales bacterium]|nr:TonB-dependent receptor [Cytophagales bacterium]
MKESKTKEWIFLMRSLPIFVLICMINIIPVQANTYLQGQEISGRITSAEDGEGLPGVNVLEKGTTNGTVTDVDGNFKLTVNKGAILVISSVGFLTEEIAVSNNSIIDVELNPDVTQLDELVVIGYGTVKKSDLTGAVVSLKTKTLTPGANVSVDQMLQGRAPGVQVLQKTGEPGAAMAILIRGASSISASNEPLYVIDGLPVNNANATSGTGSGFVGNNTPRNPLNSINPADIESIEILKDASASAIYGARGANGVVLITTKSGSKGKLKVSYDGYYGVQDVANQIEVLSAEDYKRVLNEIIAEGGGNAGEEVGDIQDGGTDWQAQLYRSAPVQNHNLSFSGGASNTNYFISVGYFNQDGVVDYSGLERYTARINLASSQQDKYNFGLNLNASYVIDDYVSNGAGINENAGSIYSAINYDPTISIYDDDGNFNLSPFITIDNPLALAQGENAISNTFRTFGSLFGEYFILPELSVKAKFGGDVNNSRRDVWIDPITVTGGQNNGIATIITGLRTQYILEGTINYNKEFQDHRINAVAGATYESYYNESFNGNGRGYTLPDLTTNAIGSGDPTLNQIGSGANGYKLLSYLGRVNYAFKDRYLITASVRADGSSRFGPNNRFGVFPSAAVAWKMNEENFMAGANAISQLKLRFGFGQIGNQSIGNYRFIPTFDTGSDVVLGNSRYTTIRPSRNPNPDLKWETTNQINLGVDFGFLEDRISGSIDYFYRKTTDLLLDVPKPSSTGFGSRTENVGSLENKGLEFLINAKVIEGPISWDIIANATVLRNEMLEIGTGAPNIITGGLGFVSGAAIIEPGSPIYSYYGYEVEGVWQTDDDYNVSKDNVSPGDLKYVDQNGDSTINDLDRTIIGKQFPDFTWGLTNTFSFKGIDLSIFIEGVHGVELLNNNLVDTYFPINFRRNKFAEPYLNRWSEENPTNEYPSFVNPTSQGQRAVNSKTVEDASYIRIQSIRLGYTVPMQNVGAIDNLNIYFSANNVATFTNYSGVDPAASANGNDVLRIDYNTYPFARTYLLGLNITF